MMQASAGLTTLDNLQVVLTDIIMRAVGLDKTDQFILLDRIARDASLAGDGLLVEAIDEWVPPMLADLRTRAGSTIAGRA